MENSRIIEPRERRHQFKLGGFAIICALLIVFLVVAWNRCSRLAVTDYQGVVLDHWAGYRASEQGDGAYFQLLIEQDNKEKIIVKVDADNYQRIQIGMKVRSVQGKIEVIEPQQKPDH